MSELDQSCQTLSWLDCDMRVSDGKKVVMKLKCKICNKFKSRICGRKHFSEKWILGADSIKTSNIRDHAKSDQHITAMNLENMEQAPAKGQLSVATGPICEAFSRIRDQEQDRLKVKFDILLCCY